MQQKNIQLTKIQPAPLPITTSLDILPAQKPLNETTQHIFITTVTENTMHKSYLDQTGSFPARSSCGNQYVFLLYDFDSNVILTQAIPNCQARLLTNAWTNLHSQLHTNGTTPTLHILDIECSNELKKSIRKI
jgi:hypothetical protein